MSYMVTRAKHLHSVLGKLYKNCIERLPLKCWCRCMPPRSISRRTDRHDGVTDSL